MPLMRAACEAREGATKARTTAVVAAATATHQARPGDDGGELSPVRTSQPPERGCSGSICALLRIGTEEKSCITCRRRPARPSATGNSSARREMPRNQPWTAERLPPHLARSEPGAATSAGGAKWPESRNSGAPAAGRAQGDLARGSEEAARARRSGAPRKGAKPPEVSGPLKTDSMRGGEEATAARKQRMRRMPHTPAREERSSQRSGWAIFRGPCQRSSQAAMRRPP